MRSSVALTNKNSFGRKRSTDKVHAAYNGSLFQSFVLVEKLRDHNPIKYMFCKDNWRIV